MKEGCMLGGWGVDINEGWEWGGWTGGLISK